ncbi:MAG: YcgN family cysteine cluster protein [Acetobacter sp.]|nr:YcgN family cysteine cluster protein [Acetobacter sp.]
MTGEKPFWERKTLKEMDRDEWESLCDQCGRCCLHKLRDDEDGTVWYTSVACRLLDTDTCRCTDYKRRQKKIPDCITLTPALLEEIDWLPPTCAYRCLSEKRPLPSWHPLKTGRQETVAEAGISAAGRCISERKADDLEDYIVSWPAEDTSENFS